MGDLTALARAKISTTQQGALQILVPSRALPAHVGTCVFGIAIAGGMLIIGFVLFGTSDPNASPPIAFEIVWFCIVGIVFVVAICSLLWPLAGYETITIGRSMTYQFGMAGVAMRTYNFNPHQMSDLRLATQANNDQWRVGVWGKPPSFWKSQTVGMITFDYGAEPFSFGTSLSALEAKMLVEALNLRLARARGA